MVGGRWGHGPGGPGAAGRLAAGGSLVGAQRRLGRWLFWRPGWRSVAGGRWLEVGGRWVRRGAGATGGGKLRYSAVRTGSIVRGHRFSDTNGSVSDAPRYAIKVLLKQP